MLMDLATGEVAPVTTDAASQWQPHTDGHNIVWEDFRHDTTKDYYGYPDIYSYDIETGKERRLTTGQGGHFHPRVDAGKVVWMDGRNNPQNGGARGCGNCPENNWDIYGYDLAPNQELTVARAPAMENSPDISGDSVVWIERGDGAQVHLLNLKTGDVIVNGQKGNADIFEYDLKNRREVRLTGDSIQMMPVISGGRVAFIYSIEVNPQVQLLQVP